MPTFELPRRALRQKERCVAVRRGCDYQHIESGTEHRGHWALNRCILDRLAPAEFTEAPAGQSEGAARVGCS
jgi:hypothetical protein